MIGQKPKAVFKIKELRILAFKMVLCFNSWFWLFKSLIFFLSHFNRNLFESSIILTLNVAGKIMINRKLQKLVWYL